jgi:hypothetical protein
MAWRPYENLIDGELDNTTPGHVSGWMRFVGVPERVLFDLAGDFHRDIRGAKIRLQNPRPRERAQDYMQGFSTTQRGTVGDITAGLPPEDYVDYPYVEWYSEENGRVVLDLDRDQVEVIGRPLPWDTQQPVSREDQANNMAGFVAGLAERLTRDKQHEQ